MASAQQHDTSWPQRSTRAHRVSYTVERVVLWGGGGALLVLVAALAKLWWWP
ncbi:MAG TPA: hypothetical protein VGW38_15860 [Chloroflexota bacterium]|nr:hypothetical protein [Chloroflexota bacterium]